MDIQAIRAIYDREQRIDIEYPDARREALPGLVRGVGLVHPSSSIIYTNLSADAVDAAIEEQITYFSGLGHEFEWKVYDYDQPLDLKDRLAARGFELEEAEAILVLDLETAPPALFEPKDTDIRAITEPAQLRDITRVLTEVWGEEDKELEDRLAAMLRDHPEQIGIYAAYVDGQPASSGWILLLPGTQFASLWGGSTLAEHRGRGLYSGLLAVRARAAREQGRRFLTVDASPMSRPILEKFGFQCIGKAYPCHWRPA